MRQQKATTPPARGAARKAQPSDSDGGDSDDDDGARARETFFGGIWATVTSSAWGRRAFPNPRRRAVLCFSSELVTEPDDGEASW